MRDDTAKRDRNIIAVVRSGGDVLTIWSDKIEERFPGRLDISRFSNVEFEAGLWVARRKGKILCQASTRKKCLEFEHAILTAWLADPVRRQELIDQMGE